MRGSLLVGILMVAAATVALLPSASAADVQPPPSCIPLQPCCYGAPCPPPCDECPPPGPCPERVVGTPQQVSVHVTVRTEGDCGATVDQTGTPCTSLADENRNQQHVGDVDVNYVSCRLNPDCTCPPPPDLLDLSAASMAPPCQTLGGSCCTLGFAPCPGPRCAYKEVGTGDFFAYLGPHAGVVLNGDCSVSVYERGMVCPTLAPNEDEVGYDAGRADVVADTCGVDLTCTCDPVPAWM